MKKTYPSTILCILLLSLGRIPQSMAGMGAVQSVWTANESVEVSEDWVVS